MESLGLSNLYVRNLRAKFGAFAATNEWSCGILALSWKAGAEANGNNSSPMTDSYSHELPVSQTHVEVEKTKTMTKRDRRMRRLGKIQEMNSIVYIISYLYNARCNQQSGIQERKKKDRFRLEWFFWSCIVFNGFGGQEALYSLAASSTVPILNLSPYFLRTLSPWYFQKALVAFLPAKRLRIRSPPGCSLRKSARGTKVSLGGNRVWGPGGG